MQKVVTDSMLMLYTSKLSNRMSNEHSKSTNHIGMRFSTLDEMEIKKKFPALNKQEKSENQ